MHRSTRVNSLVKWQDDLSTDPATCQNSCCLLCGGEALPLCIPHVEQSILSDGRIVSRPLKKSSCIACGTACHSQLPSREQIDAIYNDGYSLAGSAPRSDAARAQAYAGWIAAACPAPRSILEVGCGSGALLRELSAIWTEATCHGIDPALPRIDRSDSRVRLERGFIEDLPEEAANYQLIIAVNVVEHTRNPGAFLASLRSRLAPGGQIVIVCPAAEPPNSELLFFDHLFTLTIEALGLAVAETRLVISRHSLAPRTIGDFQMVTLDMADVPSIQRPRGDSFRELWSRRNAYLRDWERLDRTLLDRSRPTPHLFVFGGGQTAALLRAYAPRTWARVELVVLDDVDEAWHLGVPVARYKDILRTQPTAGILVATSPRVQGLIGERLRSAGLMPIRWDDLIAN